MKSEASTPQPAASSAARRAGLRPLSLLRLALLLLVYGASLLAAGLYFVIATINEDLPADLTTLLDYQPSRTSTVLAADGTEIGAFSIENRITVSLDRVPPHVAAAFLAAEDRRFYHHVGFDLIGIARAAWRNFRGAAIRQGGSTITQQIIKQTLLTDEEGELSDLGLSQDDLKRQRTLQKYRRKMKEVILAVRVERELTKAEILSIYLNHVYLGHGAYGVASAAMAYFGKDVEDLSIAEAAMLAGLVASPTKYAPHRNIALARDRQRYVLGRMREDRFISPVEHGSALAEPIALVDDSDLNHLASPYFVEQIRQLATARYGNRNVFKGGLTFYSTLDTSVQLAAESALRRGLEALDRKLGFRGPIGRVAATDRRAWTGGPAHPLYGLASGAQQEDTSARADAVVPDQRYAAMIVSVKRNGVVVDLGPKRMPLIEPDAKDVAAFRAANGAAIEVGDLVAVRASPNGTAAILAQRPTVQGSIVVIEPSTGRILALVGGYDWTTSQFDRATSARRQVGSAIKPFIYAAALEAGRTAVDTVYDGPISIPTATGVWTPGNYDDRYRGSMTLLTALALSVNTISVQLAQSVGISRIIDVMRGFGITSPIPRHISISLGTPDLTPLELAAAYAGIANGGRAVTPRFYDLVADSTGAIVDDQRDSPPGRQVISPEVAYVLVHMMKRVVERGTARAAHALGRPAAGKTGTSADYKDVWFIGFSTDLLCSVWIGRDDSTPIGDKITGGGAAVPIWLDVMQNSHLHTAVRDFSPPENVVFSRVDPASGDPARPGGNSEWMPFARGTLPARYKPGPAIRAFADLVPAPDAP